MADWAKALMDEAISKGMCDDFKAPLSLCFDKVSALELYMTNPVWAISHDYPTYDTIKEHFSNFGLEGLFVGYTFDGKMLNSKMCYVMHGCSGTIYTGLNVVNAIVPTIHLAHGCNVKIVSSGPSVIIDIHLYDDSVVETEGNAKFRIKRHD